MLQNPSFAKRNGYGYHKPFRRPRVQPNMIQQPLHAEIRHSAPDENPMSPCGHIAMGILQNEQQV